MYLEVQLELSALSLCILAQNTASCLIRLSPYPCDGRQVAFSLRAAESQMILIGIAAHHVVNACTSASWLISVAALPSAIVLTSIISIVNYSSPFSVNIDSLPPILLFREQAVGVYDVSC